MLFSRCSKWRPSGRAAESDSARSAFFSLAAWREDNVRSMVRISARSHGTPRHTVVCGEAIWGTSPQAGCHRHACRRATRRHQRSWRRHMRKRCACSGRRKRLLWSCHSRRQRTGHSSSRLPSPSRNPCTLRIGMGDLMCGPRSAALEVSKNIDER